jgi:mRNA-degrading endonuclease toxin of MazEF toxin-antitoxin module
MPLHVGDVFYLDLTPHTSPSQSTMKKPHCVVIIMNPGKVANEAHRTINIVPLTSVKPQLWDAVNNRPRIFTHIAIEPQTYPRLTKRTLIKCEQIFTIDRDYFTDLRFQLSKADILKVREKMAYTIGFGST